MTSKTSLATLRSGDVIQKFRETGALLEGHFVLSSGLHSAVYLQCALVLQHPLNAEAFGRSIAAHFPEQRIDVVAAPAIGGLVIGHEVARALNARFIWTERENGKMTLRRGFSISPDEKILVVEDVVTTGGSTRETIDALQLHGGNVIGAASLIDRSSGKADVGVPRIALATLDVASVEAAACEACNRGEPVVKPGSRESRRQ
ncbi:MAG TPA: orotate phosphoribosyltransferase [Pyrinomonadaceae bacterium]|nr:orotate phosphoribosyltransferase [Pyrinomonadaceae bacterium]